MARFSEASRRGLLNFLSGTRSQKCRGTLPWKLAQRGPELIRLVAEFLLEERTLYYAGGDDGCVNILEMVLQGHPHVSMLQTVPLIADRNELTSKSIRIQAIVSNSAWLLAAEAVGKLHVMSLPSCTKQGDMTLGTSLPVQNMAVVDEIVFVASKRMLFVVDFVNRVVHYRLPIRFSAHPSLAVQDYHVFVQCDEAVCVWRVEQKSPITFRHRECNILQNPHRQLMVAMIIPPRHRLIITASPEEIRAWQWSEGHDEAFHVVWSLPACSIIQDVPFEIVSLAWSVCRDMAAGMLFALGIVDGSLEVCEVKVTKGSMGHVRCPMGGLIQGNPHAFAQGVIPETLFWSMDQGWRSLQKGTNGSFRVVDLVDVTQTGESRYGRHVTYVAPACYHDTKFDIDSYW